MWFCVYIYTVSVVVPDFLVVCRSFRKCSDLLFIIKCFHSDHRECISSFVKLYKSNVQKTKTFLSFTGNIFYGFFLATSLELYTASSVLSMLGFNFLLHDHFPLLEENFQPWYERLKAIIVIKTTKEVRRSPYIGAWSEVCLCWCSVYVKVRHWCELCLCWCYVYVTCVSYVFVGVSITLPFVSGVSCDFMGVSFTLTFVTGMSCLSVGVSFTLTFVTGVSCVFVFVSFTITLVTGVTFVFVNVKFTFSFITGGSCVFVGVSFTLAQRHWEHRLHICSEQQTALHGNIAFICSEQQTALGTSPTHMFEAADVTAGEHRLHMFRAAEGTGSIAYTYVPCSRRHCMGTFPSYVYVPSSRRHCM